MFLHVFAVCSVVKYYRGNLQRDFHVISFSARTGRHVLYVLLPVCCIDGRCAGLELPAVEDGGQKKLRPILKFVINLYKRNKNKTKGNKV